MKILLGMFCHETNTFATEKTDITDFQGCVWLNKEQTLTINRGGTDYVSGMIRTAKRMGAELIPTFEAYYVGGTIKQECYNDIKNRILTEIRAHQGEADGICLALHGAAVTEELDDPESDLIREIRAIVGPDMPITASFDLHGNITAEMVSLMTSAVSVREYPHFDCDIAGEKAMEILIRTIRGEISPRMGYKKLPMLLPPATGCTLYSPAKEIKEYIQGLSEEKGALYTSFFHGFPYADIPHAGPSVVVTTDGDQALADETAERIARYIWGRRDEFIAGYPSVQEAMDKAMAIDGGPIVINETSDNPGGGAPADGTHLLREMLQRNIPKTCFGFIYDPEFAELAERAGVGNTCSGLLGGKTEKIHGYPIEVKGGYVKCLTDGKFINTNEVFSKGAELCIGKTARIIIGNVDVIVGSVRLQTPDDKLFLLHGIDISEYKIVALKSTHHFRRVFEDLAEEIVTADPPGIHTANFSLLYYKNLQRPIFPLDEGVEFS